MTPERFDAAAGALPGASFFGLPFEEAIAWANARVAVPPEEFYDELLAGVRRRAFTVAALATLDQVQGVLDSLRDATASGQTLEQWRQGLADEALALSPARQELIFRNALQTHYGIGRSIQQRANARNRPFLMWDAINDSRTRPSHRAMDGHIAPIDDPIWQEWTPPAGHNCRCTRISLTQRQAEERGYSGGPAPAVQPDDGWAGDPSVTDADLRGLIDARLSACTSGQLPAPVWCSDGPARALLARLLDEPERAG